MSTLRRLLLHSKHAFSTSPSLHTTPQQTKSIVIALGGNAILKQSDKGTADEMINNINNAVSNILNIPKSDPSTHYNICITHGNGPQVGSIFLQNQLCSDKIPPLPLSFCGAMTQGYIGYLIQQSITNQLNNDKNQSIDYKGAVSLVNQVGVSINDTSFKNPTKPIGKFYNDTEAENLRKDGYFMKKDGDKGWRITVPSPKPIRIVELQAIKNLFYDGYIVVTGGGGGIPVVIDKEGENEDDDGQMDLYGIDAVIDKDLTSVLLAKKLWADNVVIATDEVGIWLDYEDKVKRRKLDEIEVNELKGYYEDGEFDKSEGSMKPKIRSVIEFVEETGRDAIICDLSNIDKSLNGEAGTKIFHKDKEKFSEGFKLYGDMN